MNELYQHDLNCGIEPGTLIGIDEAGRGALAGPVVAAAVCLDYGQEIEGLNDSKKLSPARREQLFEQIIASARAYRICEVDSGYIDTHNILQATLKGMAEAACAIAHPQSHCLIDGNQLPPGLPCSRSAVVRGDGWHACIAAASILAKVHRDRLMVDLGRLYPLYGFERHKGYGTAGHLEAIRLYGPCEIHRFSFYPVSEWAKRADTPLPSLFSR